MSDKKILQKLFKIAKKQQKIIEKLAQDPKLTALVSSIINSSKQWVTKNIGDGIVNIHPKLTDDGSGHYEIEIYFTISPEEVREKMNSNTGAYKMFIKSVIDMVIPPENYTLLVMVNPTTETPSPKPYDPDNRPKL